MSIIIILKTIFLGIVEGITEFLPVSSTGHMIIVEHFIKLSENKAFVSAFEVIIQLGAILSVLLIFWSNLWVFSGTKEEQKSKWILWSKVLIAVLPAAVLGLKFDDYIEEKLFNPLVVAIALIFYGIVLIVMENHNSKKKSFKVNTVKHISYKAALGIGVFQCLAMVPGTSRSAATIIGGILFGLNRKIAAEFSFFLAIPTMFGASLLKVLKLGIAFSLEEWIIIFIGFIVSFVVALAVIKLFLNYIKDKDFKIFAYYRIVLGIIVLFLIK